jgi:hypothetical protein
LKFRRSYAVHALCKSSAFMGEACRLGNRGRNPVVFEAEKPK